MCCHCVRLSVGGGGFVWDSGKSTQLAYGLVKKITKILCFIKNNTNFATQTASRKPGLG